MTRAVREARDIAEQQGLQVEEVRVASRHYQIIIVNRSGLRMCQTVSKGSGGNGYRDIKNMRMSFKRFASGQTHGLKVVSE